MAKKNTVTLNKQSLLQVGLVVLLVAAAFAIGSMWSELKLLKQGQAGLNQPTPAGAPEEITQLTEDQWQEVQSNPAAVAGSEDAKVTLVEFTDYQCPFCKRHFDETAGLIDQDYVKTGKVRHVTKDLPLSFHANAHVAAEAARCAGDQDQYMAYHDLLFENQDTWADLTDPATEFTTYASQLGLNASQFASCYDSEKYVDAIDDDLALAAQIGANGTPTFYIEGQIIVGAQPYSTFQNLIDAALNE